MLLTRSAYAFFTVAGVIVLNVTRCAFALRRTWGSSITLLFFPLATAFMIYDRSNVTLLQLVPGTLMMVSRLLIYAIFCMRLNPSTKHPG